MIKRLLFVLFLLATLVKTQSVVAQELTPVTPFLGGEYILLPTSAVNLRTEPTTDSGVITPMGQGTVVRVLDLDSEGVWARVCAVTVGTENFGQANVGWLSIRDAHFNLIVNEDLKAPLLSCEGMEDLPMPPAPEPELVFTTVTCTETDCIVAVLSNEEMVEMVGNRRVTMVWGDNAQVTSAGNLLNTFKLMRAA